MTSYDVIIIGAGPGGIFSAYEITHKKPDLKVAVFESGHALEKRRCPIDGDKVKSCINCKTCSIMSGFGGAGAFSDGKYNITNDFGGTLHEYIGKKRALELMRYVDEINMRYGGEGTKLYTTAGMALRKECIRHDLHLLDASVRHLGTDINYVVLQNIYLDLKDKVDFYFDTGIIEMIYALDKVAPGTANDDTLLYGVEVKFYNMEVEVDKKLQSRYEGLYIIGDGSGITHSLSHASASGVHVADNIIKTI